VVVVWWLARAPFVVADLGPGTHLVTRAGLEFVLVGNAAAEWRVVFTEGDSKDGGYALPAGLRGWPALDSKGDIHALHGEQVVCLRKGAFFKSVELPSESKTGRIGKARSVDAEHVKLVGTDAADQPVLMWLSPGGPRLFVRDVDNESWQLLAVGDDEAQPIAGIKRDQLLLAPGRRAVAFPGRDGWEAWLYGSGPVVRRIAEECRGPQAAFSPGGDALIVDGKVKGLWRFEMEEGTLRFMAEGNLGHHDRIPFSVAFRELEPGDESTMVMAAPQRDLHGHLQIFQTHLSGGGRWSLGGGSVHHYAPAFSEDGQLLSYVQADFDDSSSDAPFEDIYLMNLAAPQRGAMHLASRRGGRPGQGPVFVGDGHALVYIAGGRVKQVKLVDD
jgi:hypothetical protein